MKYYILYTVCNFCFSVGMMGVIWYIAWVLIVTESPATYGNISQQELEYIQQSIGFTETQAKVTYNDEMLKYCYAPGC